ncbi:hypothetical protein C8J38_10744 [Rhizobium sp. PP-WC-2G-219]|nr:hypothetical protein C8J38_10744 [Rhizobium sp. PP-WC-2G-219]
MPVREMTDHECMDCLSKGHVGHLACSKDGVPYIVPIHYAYGIEKLYVFSLPGQKIDWLRSNPHACLQMEERSDHRLWKSVVVQGQYQELPDTPEHHNERLRAWDLLQEQDLWWEPGYLKPDAATPAETAPVFFGVLVDRLSGRQTF